ncbi:hypothetical protein BY458DRAFT_513788 [Sporodiniella umbellata]|nr:hypothetical protein BY458DRAFT_513788 [Sporodiniella umbellata]
MATIQQRTPISLQTDDEDIALSNYLTKTFQPQEVWLQAKQPYVINNTNNKHNNQHHYQQPQQRRRTTSSPVQLQKSTSTPVPSNRHSRPHPRSSGATDRRRSHLNHTVVPQERRPSFASSIASSSVESDISTASNISFSKKLRKVFSMSNIRSSRDFRDSSIQSGSAVSISSTPSEKKSLRRRSIASLSSLFQRSSIQEEDEPDSKKRPELKVDVKQRKKGPHYQNNNGAPDSPNSAISSRSFHRLPPPVNTNHPRLNAEALPSPTPSSSSSTTTTATAIHRPDEALKKPNPVGLQYGIGLHASPKLKPAASSSSSLHQNDKRKIQFYATVQVHETYSSTEYDRRCDSNATCQKLTPVVAMKIKQELNEYKLSDMEVHVDSRQYTHFFL